MPFDVPEHRPALTRALETALTDCGAEQWCQTPAWVLAEHLVLSYEAFVVTLGRREQWAVCRERDPHWCPPNRTEPQG